jgi:hypothetical protein
MADFSDEIALRLGKIPIRQGRLCANFWSQFLEEQSLEIYGLDDFVSPKAVSTSKLKEWIDAMEANPDSFGFRMKEGM